MAPVAGRSGAPLAGTIGVDLFAFSALHMLTPGSASTTSALLVLPVLMAGVLTPRLLALGTWPRRDAVLFVAWLAGLAGAR